MTAKEAVHFYKGRDISEKTFAADNIYRLDHAVTATQKKILHAFGMTENTIKYYATEIGNGLKEAGGLSNGKKN